MRRNSFAAVAAVVAFAGISGGALAATPTPVYLMKAGAGDLYERNASTLVLGSTRDPGIRRFASEMVADHSKSTAMVKKAAMGAGLHPKPPMLDPKQRGMIAALRAAKGHERDRLYVDQQKAVHREALALHQDYAATGDVRPLRRTAGEIVPVVQHHIMMLDHM
jgi:putative membrane protein